MLRRRPVMTAPAWSWTSTPVGHRPGRVSISIWATCATSTRGPKTDDNNTNEFHLGISYDVEGYFTPSYTAYYSDDWFGGGPSWYHDVSVEMPLPYDFTLAGHYGWNRFDDSTGDYEDYSVGISREYMGFGFDLSWVSRSNEDLCSAPFQCGDTGVFTVSKSF